MEDKNIQSSPAAPALPLSALSRARESLVCGALGDALGYAVEFDSWAQIRAERGPRGIQDLDLSEGEAFCSDDTQMTLFLQEGLILSAGPDHDLASARHAFLDWEKTQTQSIAACAGLRSQMAREEINLWRRQAPGNTCLSALAQGARGSIEAPINGSKGCGGVMRAIPAAFMGFLRSDWDARKAWGLGARQAALTHGHPEGWASSGAAAALAFELLRGKPLREAAGVALELTEELSAGRAPLTVALGRKALEMDAANPPAPKELIERLGQGWVGEEAFAVGLFGALVGEASTAAEGLRVAANHSGDSDSTASIAGQFLGAAGLADSWCWENAGELDLSGAIGFCHKALERAACAAWGAPPPSEIDEMGRDEAPSLARVLRHGLNLAELADEADAQKAKSRCGLPLPSWLRGKRAP